jgi:hypothetical protein
LRPRGIDRGSDHGQTTNQTIRREALLWKIQAVPIMRETLFHANPYIALGDTWVFLTQMDGYFQSGPGRQALGGSEQVRFPSVLSAVPFCSLARANSAICRPYSRSRCSGT